MSETTTNDPGSPGQSAFERIIVLPRSGASELDLDERYAVVSINDPGDPCPVKTRWGLLDCLTLHFHDFDTAQVEQDEWSARNAMQPEHAMQIWEFVRRYAGGCPILVVHCFAGVSRSISVAMALADGLKLGRNVIGWANRPEWIADAAHGSPPNRHVYETMMRTVA